MPSRILAKLKLLFEGDPAVRKVADDPVLSAELLLLFRMMLADGQVQQAEIDTLRRIATESFGIAEDSLDGVVAYLQDFGYETTSSQSLELFRGLPRERRVLLAQHLAEIAKADRALGDLEIKLLKRTLAALDLNAADVVGPGAVER